MSGEHGDGRARSELLPQMYSPAVIALFERVKARLRPGRPAEPRRDRATRRRSTPTSGWSLRRPCAAGSALGLRARRWRLRRRRCTAAPGSASAAPTTPSRRRDVPVLPGDQGREGLHPRPRAGAAGDGRRHAGHDGWRPARCTRPSTCACPARAARRTARPGSTWRPTRRRCCTSGTAAGCGRARHYALGWLPRWARLAAPGAAAGQRGAAAAGAGRRWPARLAGIDRRRPLPGLRRADVPSLVRQPPRRPGDAGVLLWVDTFTNDFSPAGRAGRGGGAGARPATRCGSRAAGLLRPDLDLHRPAGRRPAQAAPRPSDALLPHVRAGKPVVGLEPSCTGGAAFGRRSSCSRRPARPARSRPATRTLAELLRRDAGWSPPDLSASRRWPSRTATSTR